MAAVAFKLAFAGHATTKRVSTWTRTIVYLTTYPDFPNAASVSPAQKALRGEVPRVSRVAPVKNVPSDSTTTS